MAEPRSADSEFDSVEDDDGDDDYDYPDLVPGMRDGTEELTDPDNSVALEPSNRDV